MSKPCTICGRDTNTGVCVICKLDGREPVHSKAEVKERIKKEEKTMSKKPCSTPGCGRAVQKEGLCYICYKAKHGEVPFYKKEKDITEPKSAVIASKAKQSKDEIATATPRKDNKAANPKICPQCNERYWPTSNHQKRCKNCTMEIKRERDRRYRELKRTQVSAGEPAVKKRHNIGMIAGKISEPESKKQVEVEVKVKPENRGNGKTACLAQLLYASDLLDGQLNTALESGKIDTKIILDIRQRLGVVLRSSIPTMEAA